jgi:hypothetical protein
MRKKLIIGILFFTFIIQFCACESQASTLKNWQPSSPQVMSKSANYGNTPDSSKSDASDSSNGDVESPFGMFNPAAGFYNMIQGSTGSSMNMQEMMKQQGAYAKQQMGN